MEKLDVVLRGDSSKPVMVFIHGWPDNSNLWEKQVSVLENHFHCVLINLPGFYKKSSHDPHYDFPELVEMILEEIKKYPSSVTLVGHDWGAYLSYLIERDHPQFVNGLITMDVGGDLTPRGPVDALAMATYQWWLALGWLLRNSAPKVADAMGMKFAKLIRAPNPQNARAQTNYLYFYLWKDIRKNILRDYEPKCPTLFIFGESKKIMFHSLKWQKVMREREDCEIHSVKAGHWIMKKQSDQINQLILQFRKTSVRNDSHKDQLGKF